MASAAHLSTFYGSRVPFSLLISHVGFWHKADIASDLLFICFWGQSRHPGRFDRLDQAAPMPCVVSPLSVLGGSCLRRAAPFRRTDSHRMLPRRKALCAPTLVPERKTMGGSCHSE